MNSTQDWFMMTGDLIINLRSNKTGDSFRFRQPPPPGSNGNPKLTAVPTRQATFTSSRLKKPRSSSLDEEEEEDNSDQLCQHRQSSRSTAVNDDCLQESPDHHHDHHHQRQQSKTKQKQKTQQQEEQRKHQQKQLLQAEAEAAAAVELCSEEQKEQDSQGKATATAAAAVASTELPALPENAEEELPPISKTSLETDKSQGASMLSKGSGTFKASTSVSSSNSSNSSSGNSSGGVTTSSTTDEEVLSSSNSFSSDGLTVSSSSATASPVKEAVSMSSNPQELTCDEVNHHKSTGEHSVPQVNSSSEQRTTTKPKAYSPEQFCHYYDANYDSKLQQNGQTEEQEIEEENTYENIGETLANHYHGLHHGHHPLSKSEESNLYNLIEDSKSFDGISLEDEGGRTSNAVQYSTSSKNQSQSQNQQNQQYIDAPSANRLAKRLFHLEGFQKDDVTRHLSKNNEYSRTVAEEYLRLFDFTGLSLDEAVRRFLGRFHLTGETQERERVLVYFSKRYAECNEDQQPSQSFGSVDAIHTLTCALMLLNTDLHEENIQRKMTCADFILNLAGLNDGGDFPPALLKALYHSIKQRPLGWNDDDLENCRPNHHRNVFSKITTISKSITGNGSSAAASAYATLPRKFLNSSASSASMMSSSAANCSTLCSSANPFIEPPNPAAFAIEYKTGYIRRKCCYEANGKRTALGRRGWRMFYATLRDLVLYLHRDENGFRKSQLQESYANSIRIHHAIATVASDYPKKKFVFRLVTADCAEYLFETSDSRELQSWVDTINTTAASLSAPALPSAVGSTDGLCSSSESASFRRELLPVSHTKLSLRDQLADQERKLLSLQRELELLLEKSGRRSTNKIYQKDFVERESYLQHEVKRYRTYISALKWKLKQQQQSAPSECGGKSSDSCSSSNVS